MSYKRNIFLLIFVGLILFSCKDPYEKNLYRAYSDQPVATYLKSRPDSFSLWTGLIERAGLFNTLNLNTTYTCFVPTNEAVTEYLKSRNLTSVNDLSVEDAATLIKYHILPSVDYEQNMFTNGVMSYPTATDDYLSVTFREGGFNSIYINDLARIINLNIKVTNGVIHVIDKVLIPIDETISDKLHNSRYGIFNQLVQKTGFEDSLKTVSTTSVNDAGITIRKKYKYTVFAVPDSVYFLEGINTLSDLKTKLGLGVADTNFTSTTNALNKYMRYHLLSQVKSYSDLSTFPSDTASTNINTLASNELINLSAMFGKLWINYDTAKKAGIIFVKTDINCKNGVIHEVNDWMPLFTPLREKIIWELTDYSDLAAVCSNYQNASLSSAYSLEITSGMVSCYKWRSLPESKSGAVVYRNNKSSENPWYSTFDHDHLRLELGMSGWIEMKSPVIIKGKYAVSLSYISGYNPTNTGIMKCSLDGVPCGGQLTVSNKKKDKISTFPMDTVEFSETKNHTLRILSIDGKLLTLDYILFEPVIDKTK